MIPAGLSLTPVLSRSCVPIHAPFLGTVSALALMALAGPAYALNECGAPGGSPPSVECDGSGNPYTGGIHYDTSGDLSVLVKGNVEVERAAGFDQNGVAIAADGNGLVSLTVEAGARISVEGDASEGLQIHAVGASTASIDIVSSADIYYTADELAGEQAGGILAWIQNAASNGSINVTQQAGTMVGVGGGIYALNEGLGSVTVTASGGIQTAGAVSHGIAAVNTNALATGDVRLIQTGGFVTTNGSGAVGIFIKHEGQGDVSGDIAGTIHTLGPASDGVYAAHYAAGAANSVTVTIRDSGSILTRGDSSYGLW
ncbi:MAG TPA: hypothetical protein VIK87_09805, partial [Sphingomonadales bacterium]